MQGCYYWQREWEAKLRCIFRNKEIEWQRQERVQTASLCTESGLFTALNGYFYQSIIAIFFFAHPIAQTPLFWRWCDLGHWTLPNYLESRNVTQNIIHTVFRHFIIYLITVTYHFKYYTIKELFSNRHVLWCCQTHSHHVNCFVRLSNIIKCNKIFKMWYIALSTISLQCSS